ncbi:hypothetical protein GL218_04638 [Daldinia childiae]|uniref:uncharacterized protein n=1 Tax=Daldinia childiae TaxID=326645 RepID=UPI0014470771|nr:uncharacterized protein GL218_04638 [Daldinia childiae]KAF3059764.1 hypothetical protein GL218_04638 [Daldinia childiae]
MQFTQNVLLLLTSLAGLGASAPYYPYGPFRPRGIPVLGNVPYPNTTIAGITVIDTPIVRLAREFARNHSDDATYKHQVRAWLFGSQIIANNETLLNTVDIEVQAVAAILHDLGWDQTPDSPVTSLDKRFEVDGAIASTEFLKKYGGENWDHRRIQLVFDAIALHTTRTIAYYKEPEVYVTSQGIAIDYNGPERGVTNQTWQNIVTEYPNFDLIQATNETFTFVCAKKPSVTWGKTNPTDKFYISANYAYLDTQLQPWGDRYVPGYKESQSLRIDGIFTYLQSIQKK